MNPYFIEIFLLVLLSIVFFISALSSPFKGHRYSLIVFGLILIGVGVGASWLIRGDHMEVLYLKGTGGFEKTYFAGLSMLLAGLAVLVLDLVKFLFKRK